MEVTEKLEHFLHLPEEKRNKIIGAALCLFGKNGYKKTSAADIASAAGISKPMVFHYFGSKKNLYLYLLEVCGNVMASGVMSRLDKDETDFFRRIRLASEIKVSLLGEHPGLQAFMESMFYETDPEVEPEIRNVMARRSEEYDLRKFFEGVDYSRFKKGVSPALVTKLLVYFSEGCVRETPQGEDLDIDALMKEFDECLELFRNNFYT